MVRFGIRAPYEQTSPTDLLNEVVMMSDMYGEVLVKRLLYALVVHWGHRRRLALAWGSACQNRQDHSGCGDYCSNFMLPPCSGGTGRCYAWIHVPRQGLSRTWKMRVVK